MDVRLHLLGTPHVVDEAGRRHDLDLDRPTALLALLALRGDWVRRTELAALLRPTARDQEAQAYLRKVVFRARRQPWAMGVDATPGRLRWRVASDVAAFRNAIARGDDAAALAVYRGPLLGDVDLPPIEALRTWFEGERSELAAAWRVCALRHARSLEAGGDLDAAASVLGRLSTVDPLDEEVVQATMRVLLAAARPRDAWSAFDAFRDRLVHDVGVTPLEATLALAERARPSEPSPSYAPKAASTESNHGATVAGVHGAPPVDGPLIGRDDLIERVLGWWLRGDGRWVTLAGLGGSGKTRLAVELAARAANDRATAFVVASSCRDVDDLATAIGAVLGIDLGGRAPAHEALAAAWGDRPVQWVLDDLDPSLASAVEAWLRETPAARVLATARASFDLPLEWLIDVPGLAVPPDDASEPDRFDAVRFFLARSERRAAVPVTGRAGLAAVASLCRRVGGLPLALELAAAWTRAASVEALLARMDRDVAALSASTPDIPTRHHDLVAVLDATLDLLDSGERAALGALAAFTAPFTAAAAAHVANVDLARMLRFMNLGLIARGHGSTYRLHPLVREVTWHRLHDDERMAVRASVREYAADLASAAGETMRRSDEAGALRGLEPEEPVLRDAWEEALALGDAPTVAALEGCLHLAWDARASYHEAHEAFRRAAARRWVEGALGRRLEARAGYFALRLGRRGEARRRLRAALAGADGADAGFAIHNLGVLDLLAGRLDAARAHFADAYARYEALDDAWGMSRAAHNLAVVGQFADEPDAAIAWGRRALDQSRSLGNARGIAGAANNLGSVLEARGDLDDAESAYREALRHSTALNDPRGEAAAWTNLGHLAERRGDDVAAAAAYERSLHLTRSVGDPIAIAVTLANLADVCVRRGEAPRARAMVREALRIAEDAGADVYVARALLTHARERAVAGDEVEARRVFEALAAFTPAEGWVRAEARLARIRWTSEDATMDAGSVRDPESREAPTDPASVTAAEFAVRAAVARALASD